MTTKKVIAVCGKGGVGKTAVSALLTKVLCRDLKGSLLVVDADPALGLHYALGRADTKTIGSVREQVLAAAESKDPKIQKELADRIDYLTAQTLDEGKDFSFIAMGHMDAKGCFCSVNGLLKKALAVLTEQFDTVLIDGEAGIEQINRQVVEEVDTLIIVTDSSMRGMKTVEHIMKMISDGLLPFCRKVGVVFNRTEADTSGLEKFAGELGVEIFGFVPFDKSLEKLDSQGVSLLGIDEDSPALHAIERICGKL